MKIFKRIFKNSVFSSLQEPSEKKQDKGGSFNAWNGTGLMPYKHNVSENPGHQEEATDASCFLVWQRKKTELRIYLANIKHGSIAGDFQFFKIQRTFKFHILSISSLLLWGWH